MEAIVHELNYYIRYATIPVNIEIFKTALSVQDNLVGVVVELSRHQIPGSSVGVKLRLHQIVRYTTLKHRLSP